ncbi:MAG: molybdopterin-dependent oxidoreductase [Firmicutes bacterium]|jgi:anaerobic selenocysteine-containing dehydrogenase|nr:molybdopterin-dependent oxidoreductase [Bacillota bacterium]
MEVIKTDCGLCINSCGIDAYVENGKLVKVEGTKENWLNEGELCEKGKHLVENLYSPNRVKYPMKKVDGKFKRISWDQALSEIADKLLELKKKYGARTLATWTGSVGVEHFEMAAFNQRFAKAFGSPNFFNPEGICFRTRILARQITFGRYPVEEPRNADCILLWGHNPDESYPPQAKIIRNRVAAGAKLIVIDPRRIPLAKEGIYQPIRPGTDCFLALAMINVIIAEELWDKEFVDKWVSGFDKLVEHVKDYTPEKAEAVTGVPASEVRRIARTFANTERACIVEGVGHLNQYANGLQTERAFCILMAITGNIDRPGGWVTCPQIRLADLRVPVEGNSLGYDEYPVFHQFRKRTPPYGSASMMTETMITEKPYPIKALFSSGSNPALTFPDTNRFLEAIKNLELFVSIDPYMTETCQLADYVLPACTSLEETGIGGFPYAISYCKPYILLRKKVVEPLHESKPIWQIWSELGHKVGLGEYFPWKTDEEVAEHFFSTTGVTMEQLKEHPAGLYFGEIEYNLYEKIGFSTETKKIELYSEEMERLGASGLPGHFEPQQSHVADPVFAEQYPEVLLTGARKEEYIGAQMRDVPALRIRVPEPEAEISPITAKKYDIMDGEMIGVQTPRGRIKIKAKVTPDILPGVVSIPHGWAMANVNLLLDTKVRDEVSSYITMRGNGCRIVKLG